MVGLAPVVDQGVAGAAVEAEHAVPLAYSAGSRLRLEMPPMFSTATACVGPGEQRAVEGRHQRRALAAGRQVAAAEVGHHVDAGQLGQQRGLLICRV